MFLILLSTLSFFFFFFNDTATTEIYTLSLHDALPISLGPWPRLRRIQESQSGLTARLISGEIDMQHITHQVTSRSEEHTSELQSPDHLVCRLLLEKKKNTKIGKHIKKIDIAL